MEERVRIDKWLWAARFFKTRSLSAKACELGRVSSNGQTAKPAREVRVGDKLVVKNEGGEVELEVLLLSEIRGPAPLAQTLYRKISEKKAVRDLDGFPEGRPSKRDRRVLNRFRGR